MAYWSPRRLGGGIAVLHRVEQQLSAAALDFSAHVVGGAGVAANLAEGLHLRRTQGTSTLAAVSTRRWGVGRRDLNSDLQGDHDLPPVDGRMAAETAAGQLRTTAWGERLGWG